MTPRDKSGDEPEQPINPNSPRSVDRLGQYAGLLNDVTILIAELEVNQMLDQSDHTFSFELIDEDQVMIPKAVRAVMPEIDQITVSISKGNTNASSQLSIDIFSDTHTVTISRSGDDEDADEPDVLMDTSFKARSGASLLQTAKQQINAESNEDFEARIIPIEKISKAELNALIMSLIYPDAERGYQVVADANFLNPSAYESLTESFRLSALNTSNVMKHNFHDGESYFSYMKQEGQPISFTFIYNENDGGRQITLQSNMDTHFRLESTTRSDIDLSTGLATNQRVPYFHTGEELRYLRSIILNEVEILNPTPVAFLEDGRIETQDAEAILIERGIDILTAGQRWVREALHQLGLDSPDTGA